MRKLVTYLIAIIQFAAISQLRAQVDPHFSQYYAYPLWLNPAMTGVINGDSRVNANFKQQWATLNGGYKTGGLSADFRTDENVSLGINIINQAAGTAGYNYFAGYATFGYGFYVSDDAYKRLNFGLQAGIINRSFDPNKLQLDNQYNPGSGYDPNLPTNERFINPSATVFDAGAGIFYYDSDPQAHSNLFLGASAAHLAGAKDPFAIVGSKSTLPVRLTLHGGLKIKADYFLDVTPHFIYIRQQGNQETALGIYSELKSDNKQGLILGAMYRFKDAAVVDVGFHLNSTLIGLSYDFNTSALGTASNYQGGLELSISFTFKNRWQTDSSVSPGL